jgi:hypothetical protein
MGRAKKKHAEVTEEKLWARYFAMQLTPEEKAAARAEAERAAREAADAGVYDRLLELRGKVKWSLSYEEMAGKDEDES